MPRVALTQEQKDRRAVADLYTQILKGLNAKQGVSRKTDEEFAAQLGITVRTWYLWNKGGFESAKSGTLLNAAVRAGLKISVEVPL